LALQSCYAPDERTVTDSPFTRKVKTVRSCSELGRHINGGGENANLAGKEAIRITEILSFSPVCEYKWILCTQLAYICTISVVTRHSCFSFWTWRLLL